MATGYLEETKRLYGVLNIRLTDRDWLVGADKGKYTIADTKAIPWYVFRCHFDGRIVELCLTGYVVLLGLISI